MTRERELLWQAAVFLDDHIHDIHRDQPCNECKELVRDIRALLDEPEAREYLRGEA